MKYYDLVYFFSGEKNVKISDALVINEILITVVRFQYIGPYHTLFFFSIQLEPHEASIENLLLLYTAISKKVVGKGARDNPERY